MDNTISSEGLTNLIKREISIIFKKKGFYIICLLLLLNILGRIFFETSLTGIDTYVFILATSHESIFLFSIFIIANLFKERYFVSILTKTNIVSYFLSKVFSIYLIFTLVYFIFVTSLVIIHLLQFGFGVASSTAIFLDTFLKLLSIFAIITILIFTVMFFKNNFLSVLFFIIIIKLPSIVSLLFTFIGGHINLNWLSIGFYLNQICTKNITTIPLVIGIFLSIFYIVFFLSISIYIFKEDRPKLDIIRFVGSKYSLISDLKLLLEKVTFIHKEASFNTYKNEANIRIVLEQLEEVEVKLTQLLERYEDKEISISKVNLKYSIYLANYKSLKEYYKIISDLDNVFKHRLDLYKLLF